MIRRAEKRDINRLDELLFKVQALHAEGRPDIFKIGAKKYTDEELGAIIEDDNTPIYVYEQDGVVIGYVFCIYQVTKENSQVHYRKVIYIDDLCVDDRFRKQGIGSKLYHHVLQVAADNGCHSVTLNVWQVNPGAERFYRKLGMTPLKTMMETQID